MTTLDLAGVHTPIVTPIRDWLRAQTAITAITVQRVYAGPSLPRDTDPMTDGGCIAIKSLGPASETTATLTHIIQFDIWAPGWDGVDTLAMTLQNTLRTVRNTSMSGIRIIYDSTLSDVPVPDPDGVPHRAVTVLLAAQATSA